ncbi:MAG: amidase [Planctomycetes bacterium]|nr:amidase [Planctomycetota bacterium]
MVEQRITAEQSGAFIEMAAVAPTASGPLDGLTFAVKDIIDVAGHKTGCGNPRWRATHPPAVAHAVCVEQVLNAGGRCLGKTHTDELAFSLLGENHHYGTPLNPKAPERVPGGSSCGSVSAVACGLVDFAIGSDTGGSVRVPASNCGILGYRPSHGAISVGGVMPFAPGFDTIGLFARKAGVLARAAAVVLAQDLPVTVEVGTVYLVKEAVALADPEVQAALTPALRRLENALGKNVVPLSIREMDGEPDDGTLAMRNWHETFCLVQWSEIWSSLGAWVTEARPDFGPATAANFELTRNLDRRRMPAAARRREAYCRGVASRLAANDLLIIPTAPTPAPHKGSKHQRDGDAASYYPRALALTALAGIGRLPQISLPLLQADSAPVGMSLLASRGQDAFLLAVVNALAENGMVQDQGVQ